jgi:prevent-host-death family protein
MEAVSVDQAKRNLSRLIERVSWGEEITITKAGRPVARLVPLPPRVGRRIPGTGHGTFQVSPDFDDPLPEDLLRHFVS